jgi:aminopeptidase N
VPAVLAVVLAVLGAACSPDDGEPAERTANPITSAPPVATTPTTTAATTTTTPPTTEAAPDTPAAATVEAVVRGIGDDYYPELGNPGYDVAHYALDLDFDPPTRTLAARATLTATATTTLDSFNLDFEGFEIGALRVDGAAADFARTGEEVTIVPPTPLPSGTEFVVEVEYEGTAGPVPSDAIGFPVGWQNSATGQHYVVAEPDAAHSWFPANDHPLDKATFRFSVTVPDGLTAAANGELLETTAGTEGTTWTWEMSSPMATYLATVVIGDFAIVPDDASTAAAGIPVRNVLPAGTSLADWPGLERQGEMIAFLSELFGPYPFDRYGIALVDGFGAALENQTLSIFDSRIAASALFEDVLIHELAHQWFGNSVSPARWQDIWLNEGFASYAEWLWIEREQGRAALDAGIAAERMSWSFQAGLPAVGAPPPGDLFNGAVYRVGAMTLHALRRTVGDDAFFRTLSLYAERYRDANATTEDFIAVAEEVAGVELDDLFAAWLHEEGIPAFPSS